MNKKLDLNALIAKKAQKEADRVQFRNIFVKSLDGEITAKKPDKSLLLETMDAINDNINMTELYDVNKHLIYSCVKVLRDKTLQEEYDCKQPDDIVDKLFETEEVLEIGSMLLDWNGKFKEMKSDIKNS